jgi:hypothetical protein
MNMEAFLNNRWCIMADPDDDDDLPLLDEEAEELTDEDFEPDEEVKVVDRRDVAFLFELEMAGLTLEDMEMVIDPTFKVQDAKGRVFTPAEGVIKYLRSLQKGFANEVCRSAYTYPGGFRFRTIGEQLRFWHEYFPKLKPPHGTIEIRDLPEGAEGWAVVPKPRLIAASDDEALNFVLSLLGKVKGRPLKNHLEGGLEPGWMRQTKRTAEALKKLDASSPGGYRVFPYQFGLRHRARSVRLARAKMGPTEFGLGLYEVICLLLTHPDRIRKNFQLNIDCAGSKYGIPGGDLDDCPSFNWGVEHLRLANHWIGQPAKYFGSASGFMPA